MSRPRFQVSQKRIAEKAGVSQSTVSLVLAGHRVSSDETSQKVLRAAEMLKYRPNLLVRGIQTGKTQIIGVMMAPFDYYWAEVLYGIHDVLAAADHVPITLWTSHASASERHRTTPTPDIHELNQIHRLLDRRVDGVILWPRFASVFVDHVNEFSSRNLPIVTIDHLLAPECGADYVGSDEAAGGRIIAEHLYNLGHRHMGHLAGPATATWAEDRRRAFERAVAKLPGATCVTMVAPPGLPELGLDLARAMLNSPIRPTSIYAATDLYAKTVYQAARELNLAIPGDLSVVGFSDDGFASDMSPPLTTVRQSAYDIGRRSAEVILARSLGEYTDGPHRDELPVNLIVRQSTAPRR